MDWKTTNIEEDKVMEKFIAELIEPLLEKRTIKSESSKLKKLLSKLKIPKSFWDNQQKLIHYLQSNPVILTQFFFYLSEIFFNLK